ncbi:hypothetical protein X741_18635 [Mesorhizobium sp. LNHC229A00]|nr:hypothetical protein X741_18635 [Mesorhizobium sp. LNHC229A00]
MDRELGVAGVDGNDFDFALAQKSLYRHFSDKQLDGQHS